MSKKMYHALCEVDWSLDSIYESVRDLDLVLDQIKRLGELNRDDILEETSRIQTNLDAVKICLGLRVQGARARVLSAFDANCEQLLPMRAESTDSTTAIT